MIGTFRVTIELGNDGMQDAVDVAGALREIARRVRELETTGTIRDVNGNRVGSFEVVS